MKIAVFTFIDAQNYGSKLQSYALYKYLTDLGHYVDYISVKNKNVFDCLRFLYNKLVNEKIYSIINKNVRKKKRAMVTSNAKKIDYNVSAITVENFGKHIKVVGHYDLKKLNRIYDAFICGSDQVWSPLRIPLLKYYFLTFAGRDKKMSYAASFGVNELPGINRRILKYIDDFKYISVREESGRDIINRYLKRDSSVVVDPVFLLNRSQWTVFCRHYGYTQKSGEYAFLFFLNKNDDVIFAIKRLMAKIKTEVRFIEDGHPEAFVSAIANAKYVFTDSFHATAFSVIFEKEFYCFERNIDSTIQQKSRLLCLLNRLGIENRYLTSFDDRLFDNSAICYDEVNEALKKNIDASKAFLSNTLEEIYDVKLS